MYFCKSANGSIYCEKQFFKHAVGFQEGAVMGRFSEKGCFVRENAPVYLTPDMDRQPEDGLRIYWGGIAYCGKG